MPYKGAGGTGGGEGSFFLGLIMMIAGGYLLLQGIVVRPQLGMSSRIFGVAGFPVTTGLVLVPFIFGIGIVFYNSRNWIGWILTIGSMVALFAGVIASISFSFTRMNAFELLTILVLFVGGIGLFLRSLRAK